MFPLSVLNYAKIILIALVLVGVGFGGYKIGHNELVAYKAKEIENAKKIEEVNQNKVDEIKKAKDEQIANINSQLIDAISQLRQRTSRLDKVSNNGQNGTGATLFAEDAEFLVREAARADKIRTALDSCYKQYDQVIQSE